MEFKNDNPHNVTAAAVGAAPEPSPREICARALKVFGPAAQTVMVMEEMAELQKELCKHVRGRENRREIAEEIADVEIMLEQMKLLHGIHRLTEHIKGEKLMRLKQRLDIAEGTENAEKKVQPPKLRPGVYARVEIKRGFIL